MQAHHINCRPQNAATNKQCRKMNQKVQGNVRMLKQKVKQAPHAEYKSLNVVKNQQNVKI